MDVVPKDLVNGYVWSANDIQSSCRILIVSILNTIKTKCGNYQSIHEREESIVSYSG